MSIIIRLQNLPWSANSLDIRRFFTGLSIPEGGVHIVGGEMGDAFIAFSTDEDARLAMEKDGGKIKDMQIKLLLSSRTEMMRVIEQARQQNMVVTQPPIMPQPPILSLQQPARIMTPTSEPERKRGRSPSPHRRSRDRSPVRDRRRSPDDRRTSKRDRSRSPSRSSRSFSRDMDRRNDRFKRDDRRYDDTRYRDDRRTERDSTQESKRYPDADHVNSKSQLHATEGFRNMASSYEQVNTVASGLYPYGNQQAAVKSFQEPYAHTFANLPSHLPQSEQITSHKPQNFQAVGDQKYPLSSTYTHDPSYHGSASESSTKDSSVSSVEQSMAKPRRRTRFEQDSIPASVPSHFSAGDTKLSLQNQQEMPYDEVRNLPENFSGNYPGRNTWPHEANNRITNKTWNGKQENTLNPPMPKSADFLHVVPMDIDQSPSDISAEKETYHEAFPHRGPQAPILNDVLPRNADLRRDSRGLPIPIDKGHPTQDKRFMHDENRKVPVKDRATVSHDDKGGLSLQDRGPLPHGNRTLPHQERGPLSHGENRTAPMQDRGPMLHSDNRTHLMQDRGPMPHGENRMHSIQEREPIAIDENRAFLMQDRGPMPRVENREPLMQDKRPMPRVENREPPVHDRGPPMHDRGPMLRVENREPQMHDRGPMPRVENREPQMHDRGPMSRVENREPQMHDRGPMSRVENREPQMHDRGPMSRVENREPPMHDRGPMSRVENREHPMHDRGPMPRVESREPPVHDREQMSRVENREPLMQDKIPMPRVESREPPVHDRGPPMHDRGPMSRVEKKEPPMHDRGPMSRVEKKEPPMHDRGPMSHVENREHPMHDRAQMSHGENRAHPMQDRGQMSHSENKSLPMQDRGPRLRNENRGSPSQDRGLISHSDGRGQPLHNDSPGRMPPSLTVEVRGLPPDARIDDILDLFRGISLPAANIRIEANDLGLEKAFIRFVSVADFDEALRRNRQFIHEGRCELIPCPASAFESAPRSQKSRPKLKPRNEDLTVQLRGLPFSCKEDDIVSFFDGLGILDLFIEVAPDGRASGIGFVEFGTPQDFRAALAMNGKMIGPRYITISIASKEMMAFARGDDFNPEFSEPPFSNSSRPPNPPANQVRSLSNHIRPPGPPVNQGRQETPPVQTRPPPCISMKGLPESVTNRDIIDFLGQVNVMPRAVHIMLHPDKTPCGDAFAEFGCSDDLEAVLQLDGNLMRDSCVTIQPVSFHEMSEVLGRPSLMPPPPAPTALLKTPGDSERPRRPPPVDVERPRRPPPVDIERPRRPPPVDVERPRRPPPVDVERPRRPLLPQGPNEGVFRERPRMEPPGRPFGGPGRMRAPWPSRPYSGGNNRPEGRFPPPPTTERGLQDFGAPGCVVSINNLHFRAGLEELLDFFCDYRITKDSIRRKYNDKGLTTGEARIAFPSPRDAQRAVRELNQKSIMGRPLTLSVL